MRQVAIDATVHVGATYLTALLVPSFQAALQGAPQPLVLPLQLGDALLGGISRNTYSYKCPL
jgi:hypothetical protein